MLELLGLFATILCVAYPIPQTIEIIKTKTCKVNGYSITMRTIGCFLFVIYLLLIPNSSLYVIINCAFGVLIGFVQGYYKIKGKPC